MRDGLLYTDRPVSPLQGTTVAEPASGGLRFSRAFRAPLDEVIDRWTDRLLRQAWLAPRKASRFLITRAAPAYLEALETDGIHSVRISIAFEDDGELTTVRLHIEPMKPISNALLIASGYADHWEERLYALADQLAP